MPRSLRHRLIAVVALMAIALGAFAILRDDSPDTDVPGWVSCDLPAAAEERRTQIDEPLPSVSAVLLAEFAAPSDLTSRPGDAALYVSERSGTVYRLVPGDQPEAVLEVETTTNNERGLSSITFDPDGTHLYINHTDLEGTNHVLAYPIDDDGVAGEGTEIFSLEQPRVNHLLNKLVFGPDGYLYMSAGDGGLDPVEGVTDGGYEEGDPQRVAQDLSNLHGKILRIDPDPAGGGYTIPADNPFVDNPDAAPEVWAYGLRNPWRFSFDRETGDLWVADVGQYCSEEIDLQSADEAAGSNFGWSAYEGFQVHYDDQQPIDPVFPVHAYTRRTATDTESAQCAAVGGHAYRGAALPQLDGAYLFGDYCAGEVRVLRMDSEGAVDVDVLVSDLPAIQSLAEDTAGEIYVLTDSAAFLLVPTADVPTMTTDVTEGPTSPTSQPEG